MATKSRSFQRVRPTYEGSRSHERECPLQHFHRPNPPFPFRPVPEIQTGPLPTQESACFRRDEGLYAASLFLIAPYPGIGRVFESGPRPGPALFYCRWVHGRSTGFAARDGPPRGVGRAASDCRQRPRSTRRPHCRAGAARSRAAAGAREDLGLAEPGAADHGRAPRRDDVDRGLRARQRRALADAGRRGSHQPSLPARDFLAGDRSSAGARIRFSPRDRPRGARRDGGSGRRPEALSRRDRGFGGDRRDHPCPVAPARGTTRTPLRAWTFPYGIWQRRASSSPTN